ncbi:carbonic anhydrase 2-like [Phymastichus coffea]|uniref:carbonic anhydrase 2-like n=1 Tax=Phymastichus coffea TaxID=108790 RepID=UPI00273CCF9C|nr:carbonic anhydrase 2-like [Phymastichus coffea]
MSRKAKKVWTSTSGRPKWRQSPVDLNRMHLLHENFPCLLLQGHLSDRSCATMTNTGSTVKLELNGAHKPLLWGGPLTDKYEFAELQFRWGPSDARGAEHSIEGTCVSPLSRFSMEAQAVHCNKKYGSMEACQEKPDGLAIIAFLFQVIGCPGMTDNASFSGVTDNLLQIKIPGKSVELPEGCMKWMKQACAEPGYYSYSGSLTTCPYSECVTWIVIPRPVGISTRQANAFRTLYDRRAEPILRNYRSQQKIHDRKILYATQA